MRKLAEFEETIGFKLPDSYRTFLISQNGGSCKADAITLENGVEVLCDQLYGLDKVDALDLNFWFKEFEGEIPFGFVIIGSDPGGGVYLLSEVKNNWEIFYYDHQYSFPESSDEMNTYKADISLNNLLKLAGYSSYA